MAEPTLVEVFGAGASQTSTTLTIAKADLTGLTPSATNTAEALLVAILLKAQSVLTEANRSSDFPLRNVTIVNSSPQLVIQGSQTYRRDNLNISLYKLETASAVDPDSY